MRRLFWLWLCLTACSRSALDDGTVLDQKPVAVITPAVSTAMALTAVTFNGATSFDPLAQALSYSWSIAGRPTGSTAGFAELTQSKASFTPDRPGAYRIELVVTAGARTSAAAVATLTVTADTLHNTTPVANAGPNQTIALGSIIRLDGSASYDPDGDPITYSWRLALGPLNSVSIATPQKVTTSVAAPALVGTYAFELTVTDSHGAFERSLTNVTVFEAAAPDAGAAPARDDGRFDPAEVYLAGTLSEGACSRDAIAHWSTPNQATVGFDCAFNSLGAVIRPSDGRLLYTNTFEDLVREYHCDDCAYEASHPYPMNVLANDPALPNVCSGMFDGVTAFQLSVEGELYSECNSRPESVRDANGTIVLDSTGDRVYAIGANGWALTESRVVNLKTGVLNPLGVLPGGNRSAWRWSAPDGFWLTINTDDGTTELWRISTNGATTKVGTYPVFPSGIIGQFESKLDGAGRLFSFGEVNNAFTDVIVRREIGGTADVVYTEASNPLVKIHISALVTGP